MGESQNATLLVTLPKPYLHILRKMASEQTFNNPNKKMSAAGLGREIICQFVDNLDTEIKARLTSAIILKGGE
jgi:hypothetical protein